MSSSHPSLDDGGYASGSLGSKQGFKACIMLMQSWLPFVVIETSASNEKEQGDEGHGADREARTPP